MEKLTCEYCGKVKAEFSFFIGASKEPDWCMHEGTGKVSCPDCYSQAQYDAAQAHSRRYQEEGKLPQKTVKITINNKMLTADQVQTVSVSLMNFEEDIDSSKFGDDGASKRIGAKYKQTIKELWKIISERKEAYR